MARWAPDVTWTSDISKGGDRMISLEEYIKAQRAAYEAGRADQAIHTDNWSGGNWREIAKEKYPAPTVSRPREIVFDNYCYRVVDGVLQLKHVPTDTWSDYFSAGFYPEVADLYANPTEEVPAF